jgi:hypothetical protein
MSDSSIGGPTLISPHHPNPSHKGREPPSSPLALTPSSHEHAASDAGRVVNGVDDHSHGIAAPLHRLTPAFGPLLRLLLPSHLDQSSGPSETIPP